VLLEPNDRSLQVHACHGRVRQAEVVRDAILHLLDDDPTLEPRDIIVMCPDIDVFAPLIHATFGTGAGGDGADDALDGLGPRGSTYTYASPTARSARPTRCSASSLNCSIWPAVG
jgi:exodeoxyribonuclease V gamma subunit